MCFLLWHNEKYGKLELDAYGSLETVTSKSYIFTFGLNKMLAHEINPIIRILNKIKLIVFFQLMHELLCEVPKLAAMTWYIIYCFTYGVSFIFFLFISAVVSRNENTAPIGDCILLQTIILNI